MVAQWKHVLNLGVGQRRVKRKGQGLALVCFWAISKGMRHVLCPAIVVFLATATQTLADCPVPEPQTDALDAVIARLQDAGNEGQAQVLNSQLWEIWTTAPDDRAQAILDRGMRRRSGYDFLGALADFDALIAYCPDYAEGWNQRAFVHFLTQNFEAALADLQHTLSLSPQHIGALSGQALTYMELSRPEEARAVLREALKLNPWLPERHLLAPGGPLAPKGTDL